MNLFSDRMEIRQARFRGLAKLWGECNVMA